MLLADFQIRALCEGPAPMVSPLAANLDQAIDYASARWPQAAIQPVEITR